MERYKWYNTVAKHSIGGAADAYAAAAEDSARA
jgi:hypothetical protein